MGERLDLIGNLNTFASWRSPLKCYMSIAVCGFLPFVGLFWFIVMKK